jgi:hypothetical protein
MLMKAGILVNSSNGRFHPIYFRMAPFPGDAEVAGAARYKSSVHHTAGFETIEEAESHINEAALKDAAVAGATDSGRRWDWDGEGVPAMVEFFG